MSSRNAIPQALADAREDIDKLAMRIDSIVDHVNVSYGGFKDGLKELDSAENADDVRGAFRTMFEELEDMESTAASLQGAARKLRALIIATREASRKPAPAVRPGRIQRGERPGPSESATAFPPGTEHRGNDGRIWRVSAYKRGDKIVHQWRPLPASEQY